MASAVHSSRRREPRSPRRQLGRWQVSRSWARLIREAEALWHVDVRALRRIAAQELGQLHREVPATLRHQVNRWLEGFRVSTRLITSALPAGFTGEGAERVGGGPSQRSAERIEPSVAEPADPPHEP